MSHSGRGARHSRLGQMLALYRASKGQGVRDMAASIGVSAATLSRLERGYAMDASTLITLWQWLLQPPTGGETPK